MSHTAFVTGASGFVGSHVARQLCEQGWNVHLLVRPTSPLEEIDDLPCTRHTGDITDPDSLQAAVPHDVDAVFHVAASTSFWSRKNALQTRINVDGTENVLYAAIAAGAKRFIHTSSFVTWGFPDGKFDEDSPRDDNADWVNYVRTKTLAEEMVLQANREGRIEAVVLNPANVLGPGDWHNWSRMFRIVKQDRLPAIPPGGGNFCDVRQVAAAHVRAVQDGQAGEKYLLGGPFHRIEELVRTACLTMDCNVPGIVIPSWLFPTLARVAAPFMAFGGRAPDITPESAFMASRDINCDSSRAERELGYRTVPLETMVRDTIDWMNEKGMLA